MMKMAKWQQIGLKMRYYVCSFSFFLFLGFLHFRYLFLFIETFQSMSIDQDGPTTWRDFGAPNILEEPEFCDENGQMTQFGLKLR